VGFKERKTFSENRELITKKRHRNTNIKKYLLFNFSHSAFLINLYKKIITIVDKNKSGRNGPVIITIGINNNRYKEILSNKFDIK
jgi:hypothetical protein